MIVIVRMHCFSVRILFIKRRSDETKMMMGQGAIREKPTYFLSLFFDDLVIEGIDTPKCLRADLVHNEYWGRCRRRFTVLCALITDNEWCDGHIVVERVGEEIFGTSSWWSHRKVLKGEGAQFEEVGSDDLKGTRRLGLCW